MCTNSEYNLTVVSNKVGSGWSVERSVLPHTAVYSKILHCSSTVSFPHTVVMFFMLMRQFQLLLAQIAVLGEILGERFSFGVLFGCIINSSVCR